MHVLREMLKELFQLLSGWFKEKNSAKLFFICFIVLCLLFISRFFFTGSTNGISLGQVRGTVTLDGKPLEGADITFVPTEGRSSRGCTDARGMYSLDYTAELRGALPGDHRVMISKVIEDFSPPSEAEREMDDAENAILKSQGIPLESGEKSETSLPSQVPLEPKLISLVPDKYAGRESELRAVVKSTKNIIDFDLSSQ